MSVSQFCHSACKIEVFYFREKVDRKIYVHTDWIESGVLCQCVRNDLQSLSELFEAVSVSPSQSVGVQHQLSGHFCLWSSSSSDQEPLLDQAADDTESVMDGPVRQ